MTQRRFDLRRSPVDGRIRKWERVRASSCLDLSTGEPLVKEGEPDYDIDVVTGSYRNRKEVFQVEQK